MSDLVRSGLIIHTYTINFLMEIKRKKNFVFLGGLVYLVCVCVCILECACKCRMVSVAQVYMCPSAHVEFRRTGSLLPLPGL